jgi:triosephosphate isomerase (TIM)
LFNMGGRDRRLPSAKQRKKSGMTTTPRPLIAGNWKMNGLKAAAVEAKAVMDALTADAPPADLMLCPPATLIMALAQMAKGSTLSIGAQDCHAKASGAHTGDLSAEMIADAGAAGIIVGHSERRADHGESDAAVAAKAAAAVRAGLTAIICVGETEEQRLSGRAIEVVSGQLAGSIPESASPMKLVIAYEPVWAIGTGRVPTNADIAEVHAAIRNALIARFGDDGEAMRILYGGSVKPTNAADILSIANVNGALVGGASLKAQDFLAIARGAPAA